MQIVGHLDAIRAHSPPFVFFLYPKLAGNGTIECRFQEAMLDSIRPLLKKLVRVSGRGTFGPVGIYPSRIEVDQLPLLAEFSKERLMPRVGTLHQMAVGETIEHYLARNRESAGVAG